MKRHNDGSKVCSVSFASETKCDAQRSLALPHYEVVMLFVEMNEGYLGYLYVKGGSWRPAGVVLVQCGS